MDIESGLIHAFDQSNSQRSSQNDTIQKRQNRQPPWSYSKAGVMEAAGILEFKSRHHHLLTVTLDNGRIKSNPPWQYKCSKE